MVVVYNPTGYDDGAAALDWTLRTFNDDFGTSAYALDEGIIPGYKINQLTPTWKLSNTDDEGEEIRNGKTEVKGLLFRIQLSARLEEGGQIVLEAPLTTATCLPS